MRDTDRTPDDGGSPEEDFTPRLAAVYRYPVKGLGGEGLDAADVSRSGLPFDRAFGLAHDRVPVEPFGTWTTYEAFHALSERPDLAGFTATLGPLSDRTRTLLLTSPQGEKVRIPVDESGAATPDDNSRSTISRWFASPQADARLVSSGYHLWDLKDAPISIINLATLRELESRAGAHVDPRRFRANFYLDGLEPWEELGFIGRYLHVGNVTLEVLRPIERCRAITVDPDTASTSVNLIAVLAAHFGHIYCGMYARVVTPGQVSLADPVRVGEVVREPRPQELTPRERAAGPRRGRILSVASPAQGAKSLEIADYSGHLRTTEPGQHLRLHRIESGAPLWRNYTVSAVSDTSSRITVDLREDGEFSPWVHRLAPGDEVVISGPFGSVSGSRGVRGDLVLLTAGIGITPALAIAGDLARRGDTSRVVKGIHVARTVASIPHLDELRASFATLGGDLRVYLTADHPMPGFHTGRPGDADLRALIEDPASVTVVICGPTAFEADMRAALSRLGVSGKQIRSDPFYSPRTDLGDRREPPRPGPFMIAFDDGADRVDAEWTVAAGSILDVADAAGLTLPAACRAGACGTCAMRVSDEVAYLVDPISPPEPGTALICCAVPISDVRVRSLAAAEDQ